MSFEQKSEAIAVVIPYLRAHHSVCGIDLVLVRFRMRASNGTDIFSRGKNSGAPTTAMWVLHYALFFLRTSSLSVVYYYIISFLKANLRN